MRLILLAVCIATPIASLMARSMGDQPQLLLTPQRLRRLQRDRQRQTVRWVNFENRVLSAPDSPERGFELALYYAVTRDKDRGREAAAWAQAHPCERRQLALVSDWVSTEKISGQGCTPQTDSIASVRDEAIMTGTISEGQWMQVRAHLNDVLRNPKELYALCEFLSVAESVSPIDLGQDVKRFLARLPTEFLLSLRPEQVEHPNWMAHIAALALVALDPNLEGSQYLQGWAIEDRHMLTDGPGVAYELLWADPYLPGVGYQNLDPWAYDPSGILFARSDWKDGACWVEISKGGVQEENCPQDWQRKPATFGHMTLVPISIRCVEVDPRPSTEITILWKLPPGRALLYSQDKHPVSLTADGAGMAMLANNVTGKVCEAR